MDTANDIIINNEAGLQWLIGSPFVSPLTEISTFRCIHTHPSDPFSPDFVRESDDLRTLLLKGFEVIGALIVGKGGSDFKGIVSDAIDASSITRNSLFSLSRVSSHEKNLV